MHLLVVTQYFWPENFRINDIVTGLHQRGHRVTVLTGHPNYPSGAFTDGYRGRRVKIEQYGEIKVIRVPMLPRGQNSGLRLALNYLSFALSASVLGPRLANDRYHAIFVYEPSPMTVGFPAMMLKALSRRPIVFYLQDLWPESLAATGFVTHPFLLKAVEQMVRLIYRACDEILVTSRAFIPRVQRLGVKANKIHYYPQYAEDFYKPQPIDLDWSRKQQLSDGFKIMFAGNMGTAQDLFSVLEAARLTRDQGIEWVFVGNGSVKSELQQQVSGHKLQNVHFLASRPSIEMPQMFAQADVLLVSLTADELFTLTVPAKLQSYLACGRPVLGSLGGEGAEIIRESGAGLVVPPERPQELAEAAIRLKAMTAQQRAELGRRGRTYFDQNFERESLLTELEEKLTEVGNRI